VKPPQRVAIFVLAATSIACLLGQMYGWWPMRGFTLMVFVPSCCVLAAMAWCDRRSGNGRLCQVMAIGAAGGLAATVGYDVFRLPFVFAAKWGLDGVLPALPLFKVFPQFGAMILGGTNGNSLAAQVIGWSYHFSNGISFGVMYAALVDGDWQRRWPVAIVFAVGLELGMLMTPYPATFGIRVTTAFVAVTLAAHTVFGVTLGLTSRALAKRARIC